MAKIGFRVDAGEQTGMGHIIRCLALAQELKKRGHDPYVWGNSLATRLALNQLGLPVNERPRAWEPDADPGIPDDFMDVWVVDLEGGCPPKLATHLADLSNVLTIINGVGYPDGDPGRLVADLVIYQGLSWRPHELDWKGFEGEWKEGCKYTILRPEFGELRHERDKVFREQRRENDGAIEPHDPVRIIVMGGGSDPHRLSEKAVKALSGRGFEIRVILGPADPKFRKWDVRGTKDDTTIYNAPPNVAELMAWADLAVISFGMTAYECLCLGLPTAAFSITDDHHQSAVALEKHTWGALQACGLVKKAKKSDFRSAIERMLEHFDASVAYGQGLVDGKGAERVADLIEGRLSSGS